MIKQIFYKAVSKTFHHNLEIILLWCFLLMIKMIICPQIAIFTVVGLVLLLLSLVYVRYQPRMIWIIPTLIMITFQAIGMIDLVKQYQKNNILLCVALIVCRNMVFKDISIIFLTIGSIAYNYLETEDLAILMLSLLNISFLIMTILLKKQNFWLQLAKNYHTELVTYIGQIIPELYQKFSLNILNARTYLELYEQFKVFMSEPSNLPYYKQSLDELSMILSNAVNLNEYIWPTEMIAWCLSSIACMPTVFIFVFYRERLFLCLAIYEIIKFMYLYQSGVSLNELIYGTLFIQTVKLVNSGLDLSIKVISFSQQSLDTYLVSSEQFYNMVDSITGIGQHMTNKLNDFNQNLGHLGGQISDQIANIKDGAYSVTENISNTAHQMKENVGLKVYQIAEAASQVKQDMGLKVYQVGEGISQTASQIKEGFGSTVYQLGENAYQVKEGVGQTVYQVKEGVGNTIYQVKEGVGNTIYQAGEGLFGLVHQMKESIGNKVYQISENLYLKDKAQDIGQVVSDKVNELGHEAIDSAHKGVEFSQQHPYLSTGILSLGVLSLLALNRKKTT